MEMNQEHTEARSDRLVRAIFDHVSRISREHEIEGLIRLNADFARDLVSADRCSLWLIDERTGELWTKVAHGVQPIRISAGEGLIGVCIKENAVLVVNDASSDERLMRRVDESTGYRTEQVMCVPLRVEGSVIGALQLLNKPGGFSDEDQELSGLLAHFAGAVIDSERLRQQAILAQLLRRELDLARDVQSRLLPSDTQNVPGLECAALCHAARSIGGDYYDFLRLGDGSFAFTLGDVSGKGIPAAVVMASVQTLLRSLLRREQNLADVITRLSQALYESSTPDRYSTLFCGIISPDRSRLRYVNAGQVAPFLFRQTGELERLQPTGVPVGLLPGRSYQEQEVALATGDVLAVVSDGIVESQNSRGDFWEEPAVEEALRRGLQANNNVNLAEFMCQEANAWAAGAEQYDDMTAVAIRIVA